MICLERAAHAEEPAAPALASTPSVPSQAAKEALAVVPDAGNASVTLACPVSEGCVHFMGLAPDHDLSSP
jgi:hypothetical protein